LQFKYSYIVTTAKGKGGIIGFANTEILIQLLGIFFIGGQLNWGFLALS